MPRGAIEKHISIHTNITAVGPFSIASEIPAIVLPRSGLVQLSFRDTSKTTMAETSPAITAERFANAYRQ